MEDMNIAYCSFHSHSTQVKSFFLSSSTLSPLHELLSPLPPPLALHDLINDLCNGHSLVILIHRFRNHCTHPNSNCFCGSNLLCEKNLLTLCRESHVHRICHFISTSIQSHGAAGYATATTTGDSIQSWQIVLKLGSLHWLFW
ncbi:uncharacterized protein [Arachis hypogaea]|uniref:uncharacterized protein n=1 Tax=Arachis hypogaea TaxID=3818 RepID=UPI003B21628D